jgi:hypothetical protein
LESLEKNMTGAAGVLNFAQDTGKKTGKMSKD